MKEKNNFIFASEKIRELAQLAVKNCQPNHPAAKVAKIRLYRPVDYHRCAEFAGILKILKIKPGDRILDIGSPQWFTLLLAQEYPDNNFHYINILPQEIEPYEEITQRIGIENISYQVSDVRSLPFSHKNFDKVISISVLEHIYPSKGGDDQAFREIHRVIKFSGDLLITLPYKKKSKILYTNRAVYERKRKKDNFFARIYDKDTFSDLVIRNNFKIKRKYFICEKIGLFSPDFFEWGPGTKIPLAKELFNSRKFIERIMNRSFEEWLANRYLKVSKTITNRPIDIIANLTPR